MSQVPLNELFNNNNYYYYRCTPTNFLILIIILPFCVIDKMHDVGVCIGK